MKTRITHLVPADSRKSFYGKARVVEAKGRVWLVSYQTVVASVDKTGRARRHYEKPADGKNWRTTNRHASSFIAQFADGETRRFFDIPYEPAPELKIGL